MGCVTGFDGAQARLSSQWSNPPDTPYLGSISALEEFGGPQGGICVPLVAQNHSLLSLQRWGRRFSTRAVAATVELDPCQPTMTGQLNKQGKHMCNGVLTFPAENARILEMEANAAEAWKHKVTREDVKTDVEHSK